MAPHARHPAVDPADDALRRYWADGSADALAALFDAAATGLWRVALQLLGDASRAEDALQETFLTVVEARSTGTTAAPEDAGAWLLGILRYRVCRQRRDRQRVPDPARVAASRVRPASDDPVAVAAQSELAAAVEREVHALPEAYRPVLRLALQHGLTPQEIAAALERPPATVRVQLARGLARLRERLGEGLASSLFAVGSSLGLVSTQGLAAIRSAVLEAARLAVPVGTATGAGAGAAALTAFGTTVIMKKFVVSAAAVAAAVAATWGWSSLSGNRQARPTPSMDAASLTAALAAPERAAPPLDQATPARISLGAPVEGAAPNARAYGDVLVRVIWRGDGLPAAGIGVAAFQWQAGNPFLHRVQGVTDADGEVLLERVLAGVVDVRTDHASASIELATGERGVVEVAVARHAELRGQVVDERGRPVPGATVVTSHYANHSSCYPVANADGEGRFSVPLGAECYVGARAPGHIPSYYFRLSLQEGQTDEATIPLRGPAGRVVGRVVDAVGRGIEGARIRYGRSGVAGSVPAPAQLVARHAGKPRGVSPPHLWIATGEAGRFVLEGVPPGRHTVRARAADHGGAAVGVSVVAGRTEDLCIELPTHAVVEGLVRGADGRPAKVTVVAGAARYGDLGRCSVASGADGRFRLDCLTPGEVALQIADQDAGRATTTLQLAAGEVGTWDPVLTAMPVIRGRVVDERGAPQPRFGVRANNLDQSAPHWRNAETDAEGRFELRGLRSEPYRVQVFAATCDDFACIDGGETSPGGAPLELVLPSTSLPTAWLRGELVGPGGEPPVGARLTLWHGNRGHFHAVDPSTGAFSIGPLPPRSVRLVADAGRWGDVTLGAWTLEPHQRVDLGTVRLAPPGSLAAHVTYPVAADDYCTIQLCGLDGELVAAGEARGTGRALLDPVPAGDYVAFAVGSRLSAYERVTVRSGERAAVVLGPDDRPARKLTLRRAAGAGRASLYCRVLDRDGVLVHQTFAVSSEAPELVLAIRAPAQGGGFAVHVRDQLGRVLARKVFEPGDELVFDLGARAGGG
ncbi:MAG: sigma-70 family RNA polymerase sigma factor [Planctomycetota bacterium]